MARMRPSTPSEKITEIEKAEVEAPAFLPVEDPLIIFTGPSPRGWHRLQTASECLQKYAWSYEREGGKEDISKRPALMLGSLVHLVLAQHYMRMKYEQEGRNPEEYMHPLEALKFMAEVTGAKAHEDAVRTTYEAYVKTYRGDIRSVFVEAVEVLFTGTLQSSRWPDKVYPLTGRIDLLFRDLGGQLWCADHKTSGRLTSKHKEYFGVSGQMLAYEHLVRQKHPDLAGFKINLIQHTDPKFDRLTLPARPLLEKQFVERAVDIERSIERMLAEGRRVDEWPKAMSELTCFTRYGACDHIDKCRFGENAGKAGSWTWEK